MLQSLLEFAIISAATKKNDSIACGFEGEKMEAWPDIGNGCCVHVASLQ